MCRSGASVYCNVSRDYRNSQATMGFDSQWPKIWNQNSGLFVVERVTCKTVFIDAQIQLMKSYVHEDEESWRSFVQRTFFAPIAEFHRRCDTVIVCFDNYQNVPIFKSIEQSKRLSTAAASTNTFRFKAGDVLPSRPYEQHIWVQALQNRTFKSNIISLITSMIAADYVPPRRATTLVVDFVNSTRIDYHTQGKTRVVLENMKPMGESDVKFMRYVPLFGDLIVDSIDSDVLLIAALFVSRNSSKNNIYVRRYKTRVVLPESLKRKLPTHEPEKKRLEYEIIHVNRLMDRLHTHIHTAVERAAFLTLPAVLDPPTPAYLTAILSFIVLLCGCDYSKKLPRIGAKTLWDSVDEIVPAILACTSYSNNVFVVDTKVSIDGLIASLYARTYTRHVRLNSAGGSALADNMDTVLAMLHASSLSDKTKQDLPTRVSLCTTLRNIEWVINYWAIENGDPACPVDGTHGFRVVDGKVVFT